jgi:hypothetical protein
VRCLINLDLSKSIKHLCMEEQGEDKKMKEVEGGAAARTECKGRY